MARHTDTIVLTPADMAESGEPAPVEHKTSLGKI